MKMVQLLVIMIMIAQKFPDHKCYQQSGIKCTTSNATTNNEVCLASYDHKPTISINKVTGGSNVDCTAHDGIQVHPVLYIV